MFARSFTFDMHGADCEIAAGNMINDTTKAGGESVGIKKQEQQPGGQQ